MWAMVQKGNRVEATVISQGKMVPGAGVVGKG